MSHDIRFYANLVRIVKTYKYKIPIILKDKLTDIIHNSLALGKLIQKP